MPQGSSAVRPINGLYLLPLKLLDNKFCLAPTSEIAELLCAVVTSDCHMWKFLSVAFIKGDCFCFETEEFVTEVQW